MAEKYQGKEHLHAFLQGTIVRYKRCPHSGDLQEDATRTSALARLRGHEQLLRMIWTWVCEEWWDLHIDRSYQRFASVPGDIPRLLPLKTEDLEEEDEDDVSGNELEEDGEDDEYEMDDGDDGGEFLYSKKRQVQAGCPAAVVLQDVAFPPPAQVPLGTFSGQDQSPHLYVNMMPFLLRDESSLPPCCRQYWDLISACAARCPSAGSDAVAYLTIDERPVAAGQSQRRPGLHVESPGVLRYSPSPSASASSASGAAKSTGADAAAKSTGADDGVKSKSLVPEQTHGSFIPGAEHHWGQGMMMRNERMHGGIFLGSNVTGSCAVWNVRVYDPQGHVVRAHGDLEHCRSLLPPPRVLRAGEIVWMTDMTPHESLPLPQSAQRQFFRLVVGDITAWFADHCTPNPTGEYLPKTVRVLYGDKFKMTTDSTSMKLSVAPAIRGSGGAGARKTPAATPAGVAYVITRSSSSWYPGEGVEIDKKRAEVELRSLLVRLGLGHLIGGMLQQGVRSLKDLVRKELSFPALFDFLNTKDRRDFGNHYYERPRVDRARERAQQIIEARLKGK